MAVWDWFLSMFNRDGTLQLNAYCGELATEVYYKELAIQSCVNLIANTVARGEFQTFEKGKEVKKDNYYLLNVEPNQNKSANKFWRSVISKLVYNNECLVIQVNGMFYVADSFTPEEFAFKENVYSNISIAGLAMTTFYTESQVFHFELHDEKIRAIIEGLYKSYSKLIAASQSRYKRNGARRGTIELPTNYSQIPKAQEDLNDLLDNRFKKYFDAENGAVLPLTNGMKYNEPIITQPGGLQGRDIRAFIDDVFDFTAIAFQIPPQLLKGNVADTGGLVNNYLTFCINPLAELIADEINRKYYGKTAYLENTYTKLDTTRIKAVDIKEIANALDVILRIGGFCVDDCLMILGKEPLNTPWSKQRWMTKNYSPIEQAMKGDGNIGTNNNAQNSNPAGG